MCVSPLKILNRSKVQVAGLTPEYYHVPCGQCWQCQQARRDGFTVRTIFEYLQAEQQGGFTLFLTLTYNDSHLRMFRGVPIFCKKDVQDYLKRVRINIQRHLEKKVGKDLARKIVSNNIRYFCSSENGSKRHRPHYHLLFFVETPNINKWIFRKIACDTWDCGFCVPSKENFGFVTDVRGCKYVAKYVGKSMIDNEYYHNCMKVYEVRLDKYETEYKFTLQLQEKMHGEKEIAGLREKLNRLQSVIYSLKDIISELKKNRPFLLCSKGLGRFANDDSCPKQYRLTSQMFVDGKIFCPDNQKGVKEYIMPNYYRRKSFYNVSSEVIPKVRKVSYKLNQFGIDIKSKAFKKYFDNYDKNLSVLLSHPIPSTILESDLCKSLGITSIPNLRHYLQDVTSLPDWKEYALLYSHYSQYLDDSEIKDVRSYVGRSGAVRVAPEPFDVYNFRQYVGSDTHTTIDYDSVNDYHDFYIDVLLRIHDIVYYNPFFPQCLNLLEMWQEYYNAYLTDSHYVADKIYNDNLIQFKF